MCTHCLRLAILFIYLSYLLLLEITKFAMMESTARMMENISDADLNEFLTEYRLQSSSEPISHYEEGELEAQWLKQAGFPELTKPFEQGIEIHPKNLEPLLLNLPKAHAKAIKQRVSALNKTVRGRSKVRHKRKPDIRDVFRDFDDSSTGTRSRSATPDSLDSVPGEERWNNTAMPNLVSNFGPDVHRPEVKAKQKLKRTPSAPLRGSAELFRGSHIRCDIPFHTAEGIELLGFQKIGTLHIPRHRYGSDPSCSIGRRRGTILTSSCSHNDLLSIGNDETHIENEYNTSKGTTSFSKDTCPGSSSKTQTYFSKEPISFENILRESSQKYTAQENIMHKETSIDINEVSETDLKKLQSILWLELAALFDKYNVTLDKRKPSKRRRKEEGNLFGVSLNALIRRDQQVTGEDSTLVPLFLQEVLRELKNRGAKEEGILRVAGHKQKTETLYNELELVFYQKPEKVTALLKASSPHDLSALLKRWLRELPQPLLATDLIQLFYQIHAIPPPDQLTALLVVCLLLPHENRNTLRALLRFLNEVISNQKLNKMTRHNVSTILAPSFFPPRYIHPLDKNNIGEQVKMAAHCCQLTNLIIAQGETLFMVPKRFFEQLKARKTRQTRKPAGNQIKGSNSN